MAESAFVQRYPVAASGTSDKTLLQLVTDANVGIEITEVSISWQGTSATAAPVQVQLLYQTTAGTMMAANPVVEDVGNGNTLKTTGQRDATAEPTAGNIIREWMVHQQSGLIWQGSIRVTPGGTARRVGLKVIAPGASVSVAAYLRGVE